MVLSLCLEIRAGKVLWDISYKWFAIKHLTTKGVRSLGKVFPLPVLWRGSLIRTAVRVPQAQDKETERVYAGMNSNGPCRIYQHQPSLLYLQIFFIAFLYFTLVLKFPTSMDWYFLFCSFRALNINYIDHLE